MFPFALHVAHNIGVRASFCLCPSRNNSGKNDYSNYYNFSHKFIQCLSLLRKSHFVNFTHFIGNGGGGLKKTGNIFRVSKAILFSICHSEKQIHRRYGTVSSRFSGKKKNDLIYESYQFIPSGIGGERPLGFA